MDNKRQVTLTSGQKRPQDDNNNSDEEMMEREDDTAQLAFPPHHPKKKRAKCIPTVLDDLQVQQQHQQKEEDNKYNKMKPVVMDEQPPPQQQQLLPDEMLLRVFQWLTGEELVGKVGLTCKRWRGLSCDPFLWHNQMDCYHRRLFWACKHGLLAEVKTMLEMNRRGFSFATSINTPRKDYPNWKGYKHTPLTVAARRGHLEVVQELLKFAKKKQSTWFSGTDGGDEVFWDSQEDYLRKNDSGVKIKPLGKH